MHPANFTSELRRIAEPIWRRELQHPFVRGIADGTLPIERFRFYLQQDYLFLIEYCRVFALAAAKAPTLDTMRVLGSLMHETMHVEMDLHRDYCQRLGISAMELERTTPAPQTHAYTRHLLNVAWSGTLPEILSAILPCQLGYAEIGKELAGVEGWEESRYAEWIRTYSSPEFVDGAERLRAMLDEMTAGAQPVVLAPMREHFMLSTRHEYLFWEMAWKQATWPI
jgi:thiaminase/transcriptional activator TenA